MSREEIDEAKRKVLLPDLVTTLGLGEHAKKSTRCPFHYDAHPLFSVFQDSHGAWFWKCRAGCGNGDDISFLAKEHGIGTYEELAVDEVVGKPFDSGELREIIVDLEEEL